jgi:hypothetical protein
MEQTSEPALARRTGARLRRAATDAGDSGMWGPVTAPTGRLRRLLMIVGGTGLLLALVPSTLLGALYLAPIPLAVLPAALALAATVHVTVRARRNASGAPAHSADGRPAATPRPSRRARVAAVATKLQTSPEPASPTGRCREVVWPTGRHRPVRPAHPA